MKKLLLLICMMLPAVAFAYGNSSDQTQGQGQAQGQSLHNQNILQAAALSQATGTATVDLDNKNVNGNFNANKNDNSNQVSNDTRVSTGAYSEGSKSSSKAKTGDNVNRINIEGDEAAASSAIAGMASECVTVLAAQASGGGFSIGGIDGDCRAAIASDRNLELYKLFIDSDPEQAALHLALVKKYAALANPSAFKIYMSGTRQTITDIALSFGWLALFAL